MKKTGIIRRIDNLGRIVIPKEIRSTLRIKNGDNLEIYVNDKDDIVLRKFSIIDKLLDLSLALSETINSVTKATTIITNNDKVLAAAGRHTKNLENSDLSSELSNNIGNEIIRGKGIYLTDEKSFDEFYLIVPIISGGDRQGSIIVLSDDEITNEEEKIVSVVTTFLGNYIE